MGALGRMRRKTKGAEAQEIGEGVFALAIDRAARKRGITMEAYMELALLFALEADGMVHVERKGNQIEICFALDECSGHA